MIDIRPKHWSEWLAVIGVSIFAAGMVHYCVWCHYQILRNGGYEFAVRAFFEGN